MNFLEGIILVFRPLLYPFSILYGIVMWIRNKAYDKRFFSSIEFDLPIINVGNLNTGGTGKTPTVEYLINLLQYRYQVATMSRGYKRKSKGFKLAEGNINAYEIGDEPMQYYRKYKDAVVSVCEDRLTGIPYLLRLKPNIDVILLDDAFQHRSVKAGLNILITDYAKPYYKDYILPFGRLREQRNAAGRAKIIIISKVPKSLTIDEQKTIIKNINPLPHQSVFFSSIEYKQPYSFFDFSPYTLKRDMDILLVSGIANPSSMIHYIEQHCNSVHLLKYADHHYYSTKDLEEIKTTYDNIKSDNKVIVVTEKDSTRLALHIDLLMQWQLPILVLPIQISFGNDTQRFDNLVIQYIEDTIEERYKENEYSDG